jgi:hypothetical protein
MPKHQNVTFIEDLIDTDTLLAGPMEMDDRQSYNEQIKNRHIRKHNHHHMNDAINGGRQMVPHIENIQYIEQPMPMQHMPMQHMPMQHMPMQRYDEEISCMTIAQHVKNCPICSKFYNPDQSMYIIAIIVLIIICIVLLKRLIDK